MLGLALLYLLAHLFPEFLIAAQIATGALTLGLLLEYFLLFFQGEIAGSRQLKERLSNGDENPILLNLESSFPFEAQVEVYDELPIGWQVRDFEWRGKLPAAGSLEIPYSYRPKKRGAYTFGSIQVLASWQLGLVKRRFSLATEQEVQVYPSYLSMLKYEYLAISNTLIHSGIKKIRRIGQHTEFEKIKEYVAGDDFRTINWKASARKNKLMANVFQDERSQQVYCIIDKGRVMDQAFEGMNLLDYAINATLVLSNIAIKKYDKAGLITFDENETQMLAADRRSGHMMKIQEMLYRQESRFLESDFDRLYLRVKSRIPQRSLLIFYTNFDTVPSMERRLPYLKNLAKQHLLLVVFFDNTETLDLLNKKAENLHQVYRKMVAEKMRFEKEQIVSELRKHGIISLLSSPEDLTINTINRYLELKARGLI
ncbi:MAG: DUF58 domain-containing protein [Bacteroidota bacterium]|nr:DUF58 domain-containing protein [Bacteroidota bacterium]MDX5430641.1 DUF58 domain-containing protein [Bacteroidota bacterium]MDX5469391.1 DUF58 domain-containing protein [Bacteroidota bacterium]